MAIGLRKLSYQDHWEFRNVAESVELLSTLSAFEKGSLRLTLLELVPLHITLILLNLENKAIDIRAKL